MLVLDANILVRAIFGRRVPDILHAHTDRCRFVVTDAAVAEARQHIPRICARRRLDSALFHGMLDELLTKLEVIDSSTYGERERDAKYLIAERDDDDWPTLAAAMVLACPVWTEDLDFFGLGVATWQTRRVEFFLERSGYQN